MFESHLAHLSNSSKCLKFHQTFEQIKSSLAKSFGAMRHHDRCALGRLALVVCAIAALAIWPLCAHAQTVVKTVTVGTNPGPVVVNPMTNRLYVASFIDAAVKVIDGSTEAVVATVPV